MSGLKRIPEIQTRLDQWAIWVHLNDMGGSCSSTLGYLMDLAAGKRVYDMGDHAHSMVPIDDIECARTERAVNALPKDLKNAVHAWHRSTGGTLDSVAKQLNVVRGTLHRRLCQADIRIMEWLSK